LYVLQLSVNLHCVAAWVAHVLWEVAMDEVLLKLLEGLIGETMAGMAVRYTDRGLMKAGGWYKAWKLVEHEGETFIVKEGLWFWHDHHGKWWLSD
jgi:hypothetical protein